MSRLRNAYEVAGHRHEAALKEARDNLKGAVRHLRAWDGRRPSLEKRLMRAFEGLWKERLDLRPRFRLRRRLPDPPWQRIGRGLKRVRHKSLKAYRRGLARLGASATDSGPARYRRFEIVRLRFRIWLTSRKALVLLLLVLLFGLSVFAPEVFEVLGF